MATAPPPPPPPQGQPLGGQAPQPGYGYGGMGRGPTMGAILPVPGNAELVVYLLATVLLAIISLVSDDLGPHGFALDFTLITLAYLISRGIAKASRVLEQ